MSKLPKVEHVKIVIIERIPTNAEVETHQSDKNVLVTLADL
jgi:hypothetical protein